MTSAEGLERFVAAQDDAGGYADVLRELRAGHKRTHWIWFVFPQLAGLGRSATSQYFAVTDLQEARAYLAHPVLGARLRECAAILTELAETDPVRVLGAVDAQKLHSSMTLFARAAPGEQVFRDVLDQYFAGADDRGTTARL